MHESDHILIDERKIMNATGQPYVSTTQPYDGVERSCEGDDNVERAVLGGVEHMFNLKAVWWLGLDQTISIKLAT